MGVKLVPCRFEPLWGKNKITVLFRFFYRCSHSTVESTWHRDKYIDKGKTFKYISGRFVWKSISSQWFIQKRLKIE